MPAQDSSQPLLIGVPGDGPILETRSVAELVDAGAALRLEIAAKGLELKRIEKDLIGVGIAKHFGTLVDGKAPVCHVINQSQGKTSYALAAENEKDARKLSGAAFRTLFGKVISYPPCEAFALVVPKVLTPARAEKLIALCEVPGKAGSTYTKWS
ncbi:MAG TPA: hypothetical protein VGO11_19640 [Chthoniobacteraceae bacterium]|jgi:hypothetical protein|nr:hypothetical protein [Chthoniobacteraceae bacterium]